MPRSGDWDPREILTFRGSRGQPGSSHHARHRAAFRLASGDPDLPEAAWCCYASSSDLEVSEVPNGLCPGADNGGFSPVEGSGDSAETSDADVAGEIDGFGAGVGAEPDSPSSSWSM